jgi:hypothetical protein
MSRSADENVVLTVSFLVKKAQRGPGPPHSWGFWITQNDTSQSVGRLSTEERPVAKTSTWQHTTPTRTRHLCIRRGFFYEILMLFSVRAISVLVSLSWLSWLVPLFLLYNTQHKHPCTSGGIRTTNPSNWAAANSRLGPLGHWGRLPKT